MDQPTPPPKSPTPPQPPPPSRSSTGAVTLSGLLPPASLIDSLFLTCSDLSSLSSPSPVHSLHTRNTAAAIHRSRLLSSLFEDLSDSTSSSVSLTPSSILCLTELHSILCRTKSLLNDLAATSALWSLLQLQSTAKRFHSCARDLASALDILPLTLLSISPDVHEQVALLHRQAKRAALFIDPRELRLRDDLVAIMAQKRNERAFIDFKKLDHIMRVLGLKSTTAYKEEIDRLEFEIIKQAGTGGFVAVSHIANLISLISCSKPIIFQSSKSDQTPLQPLPSRDLSRSVSCPVSSTTLSSSTSFIIPDEFRCPITLDLMRDPVIVASGHSYDRIAISRWINSGHHTCPKSGNKLIHMALIPNYALKSLIEQWCKEHNFLTPSLLQRSTSEAADSVSTVAKDHISELRAAMEAVRMTAEFLVGKIATGSSAAQRQAAYELRLLAKTGMDNCRIIVEAGAIPFLITLLVSTDAQTQENAVTVLLNLSIFDKNKILIMSSGAIDAIIRVLIGGKAMEARENAAATLFSLSILDECKLAIGGREDAVAGLVGLLREGTTTGKRDAAMALFNLAVYGPNKVRVVKAGVVKVLVDLLMDDEAGVTDDVLAVLALLIGCEEGIREIRENMVVEGVLVELLRFGSEKGKENSIVVLLGLFKDGGEEMGRRLLMNPRSVSSLQGLVATGSPRAKRKADALLRLLNRCLQSNFACV
ncbi:U-box domain-containing protein 1-like [Phalaenopsis equestris]|uniref:U-box domain-containing protein 1-like n=1 Tax=Phalaenopsis equestris TaxID=78828 RepID=UPI0009E5F6BD|nr:U-box domain-containing protein 1-like [Phalaenopsis equestris]